jgi:hypothetical protein
MSKFRKKPIIVEAEQFDGTQESITVLCNKYASDVWPEFDTSGEFTGRLVIDVHEGRMIVSKGDWIITDAAGKRYPCDPEIFKETYEEIEDERLDRS